MRLGAKLAIIVVCGVVALACGPSPPSHPPQVGKEIAPPPAPLSAAIREATHLGPAGPGTEVYLTLGLKVRQPDQLASLLAAGQRVSPAA